MPSTEDLQRMYMTAKAVLHEQLGQDFARYIGRILSRDSNVLERDTKEYLEGQYISDLLNNYITLRELTHANVDQLSTDFLGTFWRALIDITGAGWFQTATGLSPNVIIPLTVVSRDGFVDVRFDIDRLVAAYKATML